MAEVVALPSMAFSRSGNDNSKKKKRSTTKRAPAKKRRVEPVPLSLHSARKDVFDLGPTGLDKRQRKIRDDARLVALGCKTPASPKMPFKMVMGIRRAENKRQAKKEMENKESGVVAPKEKRDAACGGSRRGKVRKGDRGLAPDPRDGILRVDHLLKRRR